MHNDEINFYKKYIRNDNSKTEKSCTRNDYVISLIVISKLRARPVSYFVMDITL